MTETRKAQSVHGQLSTIAREVEEDRYMLMEYLGPVVDGCRAAMKVSVGDAQRLGQMCADEMDRYIESSGDSFTEVAICFRAYDTNESASIVFDSGRVSVYDECVDCDVTITGTASTLLDILDVDASRSPVDLLGSLIHISGSDSESVIEGLGLLCFPTLLKMARSGVDPSSLLSEDADALIMAAASDMVTKLVRRWIDLQLGRED